MADTPVLTTTRYVKPGAYIGRIIRPDPTTTSFVRTPCYIGRGSRLQTLFNILLQRSYISDASLTFATTSPNVAPLAYPAANDQTVAVLYNKKSGSALPVPASKWKFIESVPGSKVYDQVLMLPQAFDINAVYAISYQSTSRLYKDPIKNVTDLRLVRAVGDYGGQSLYIENEDFLVNSQIGALAAAATNGNTTTGFTNVVKARGVMATGSITIAPGANYTHAYNRTYTVRCSNIGGFVYTFEWESIEDSAGASMLPRVPVATPPNVSAPTFDVDVSILNPQVISLTHHLFPGGGDLGVSLLVDPVAGGAIAVGDVWQFTALGTGLLEMDSSYTNTNQFSVINTPVPTLQGGSTGSVSIYDYTEFTGSSNRTYAVECIAVAGVSPNRQATFAWQGYGDAGVLTGVVAINETTGSNLGVVIGSEGLKLNFSFGAGHFVVTATPSGNVGDLFTVQCLAPMRTPIAKDNRDYKISVNSGGVAVGNSATLPAPQALGLFYAAGTVEGGYNLLNLSAASGSRSWAITLAATLGAVVADPGNIGAGVITASGTPLETLLVEVKMMGAGIPGVATFQVSLDGGATFGSTLTSPVLASSYTIPGTGIVIQFAGLFAANDVYRVNSLIVGYNNFATGAFTIPGDFMMWARNIGADRALPVRQNRYVDNDQFTFTYTDLLTFDWALEARSTESFNTTQLYTDVLGTVTGVAGRKYLILLNNPASIQYVHNTPSGTPLSYVQVAGTQYLAFPIAPVGGVQVLYTWRGAEPDPGNFYYATVDVMRPIDQYNKPIRALNNDDANRIFGPVDPSNDVQIMANIAFENNSPQVMICQVYDSSGSGAYSDQDYKTAVTATEKNSMLTDITVLNRFSVLSASLVSNEAMNNPFERKERMLWVGCPANTAIGDTQTPGTLAYLARNTLQVFGDSQAHGRRVLLGNTFASRTITLGDGSRAAVSLDGSFVAGAAAAKNASFTDPGTLLLRTTITGFDNELSPTTAAMQTYGEDEELELGGNSILYLSNQGTLTSPVFRFEESTTVDASSSDNHEINAQNQQFFVTRDIRSRLDSTLIGFVPPSQQSGIATIKNQLIIYLNEYIGRGIIADYSNDDGSSRPIDPSNDVIVMRDKSDKTLYFCLFWYNLRYGIKRVFGLYAVDKRVFGSV